MKGQDLGVKTWPSERWKQGGGTVWGWISYDPDLNLIYYGTANAGPWNPNQRPGDNLWTTTIFARTPETGMAKWAYAINPHDLWEIGRASCRERVEVAGGDGGTKKEEGGEGE